MFLGAISFFVKIASFFQSDIRGRESLHCFAKSSWEIFCSSWINIGKEFICRIGIERVFSEGVI